LKTVAICSENKRCVNCGRRLELKVKKLDWLNEQTGLTVKRLTNVFSCKICHIDHVMQGTHIDDSGWHRLILPILSNPVAKRSRTRRRSSSSPVRTYYDPSLIRTHAKEDTIKNTGEGEKCNARLGKQRYNHDHMNEPYYMKEQFLLEKSLQKTISQSMRCENCHYYHYNGFCSLRMIKTKSNGYCERYIRHHYVKVYHGGRVSPR
jgi:hypothetical protein